MTEIWVNRLTYLAILLLAVAGAIFFTVVFIDPYAPEGKQKFLGIIYLACLFGGVLLSGWISRQRWYWKNRN